MSLPEFPDENDFFSFPVEPDDDEAVLSFDKLREAFANLEIEKTDSTTEFVCFDETPHSTDGADHSPAFSQEKIVEFATENSETVAGNDANRGVDEDGEPYESITILEEDRCELSPRTIFEAMLFVGNRENQPLEPERAAELMRNVSPEELVEIVHELNAEYARVETPYHIIREDDGYRMVLRSEYEEVRSRFYNKTRETRLSQAAIDVLAVVAYKQPVTAEEVQKIRKSPSQPVLQQLVRRGLIDMQKIIREKKTVTLFRTTDRFLRLFQITSLDDLPTAEEIDFR